MISGGLRAARQLRAAKAIARNAATATASSESLVLGSMYPQYPKSRSIVEHMAPISHQGKAVPENVA